MILRSLLIEASPYLYLSMVYAVISANVQMGGASENQLMIRMSCSETVISLQSAYYYNQANNKDSHKSQDQTPLYMSTGTMVYW